jgi:hypothetical protein
MLWVGGGQGAGKTILSWHLSRANDLPLHPVDLWTYDHQARLPAGDSLDEQLARGPEAAADAFESASLLRLELVLHDILARDRGGRRVGARPALRSAPRLPPGSELSRQRRHENRTAERQGRLWMREAGLAVMPSYPFGCECGGSGCRATWTATPDDYAARTTSERPLIAHGTPLR